MINDLVQEYVSLIAQDKTTEAFEVSKKVLDLKPQEPHYYYNHAMMAHQLERYADAVDAMNAAKEILPECPVIRRYLSDSLLQTGRYKEGLAEREFRFKPLIPGTPAPAWLDVVYRIRKTYPQPDWDGNDLRNKTLLIFNEAGHGDLIQHLRYLPVIKDLGCRLIVEVKPELEKLVKTAPGVDEVFVSDRQDKTMSFLTTFINKGQRNYKTPPANYVMSCQSIPYYFDPDLSHIPMKFPYLFPDGEDNEATLLMRSHSEKFKIGIAWAGNWKDANDRFRSLHLKHFRALTELPFVQVFSIQKCSGLGKMQRSWWQDKGEPLKVDLIEGSEGMQYIDLEPYLEDFYATAKIIANLDLVICVDTAVAHIAGAMGVPVWLLASKLHHEWRWHLRWYDSMRVWRQDTFMDWDGLCQKIVEEVQFALDKSLFCPKIGKAEV